MTRWSLIALVLLVSTPVVSLADSDSPRTITTSGEAAINVVPDEVVLQLGVVTFDASMDQAKSQNDESSKRLVSAVKSMGIEDKRVQTSNMELEIVYDQHNRERVAGYRVKRAYSVTLKDASKLEALFDSSIKNGANVVMGVDYRSTALRKHRDEARKLAVAAAREKAELFAQALNCKVGAPRTINEFSDHFGYWGGRWAGGAMTQNVVQDQGGAAGEGGESTPLGQLGIRAGVSVVFDLVPDDSASTDEKPKED